MGEPIPFQKSVEFILAPYPGMKWLCVFLPLGLHLPLRSVRYKVEQVTLELICYNWNPPVLELCNTILFPCPEIQEDVFNQITALLEIVEVLSALVW